MSMFLEPSWPDRRPIWEDALAWTKASAAGCLVQTENPAVQLAAGESRPPFNFHLLRFGPQRTLHTHGESVFDQIRSECDFSEWDCWDDQKRWLMELFRTFYPEDEDAIGTFSVLAARRPSAFREWQDPTITITQGVARPHYLMPVSKLGKRPLMLGDRALSTQGLRLAGASESSFRKASVAMTVVPRRVRSTRFGIDARYDEYWVCLAERTDHHQLLRDGRLPVAGENHYKWAEGRLRFTPLLNLVSISRTLMYTILTAELHPVSAEVLSLRWARYPLAVAMLQASPVEHFAVQQALTT